MDAPLQVRARWDLELTPGGNSRLSWSKLSGGWQNPDLCLHHVLAGTEIRQWADWFLVLLQITALDRVFLKFTVLCM